MNGEVPKAGSQDQSDTSPSVTSLGERSVAIGGDARETTIITGDVLFKLFLEAPRSLAESIRSFQTLIQERTRAFVGREFVFNAIDRLLGRPDFPSGYILIVGEPGIGKTSLLARLVQQRGYVHHFNIAAGNIRSYKDFLRNVCAQLIVRYELDHATLPFEAGQDNGFLSQVLAEAAATCSPRSPLVILVDALDEAEDAGLPPSTNRLFLPGVLPDNVYFIITSRPRPEHGYGLNVDHLEIIYIDEADPQNVLDVERFIRRSLETQQEVMSARLREWNITPDAFVEVLKTKSEGNFLYLVMVMRDMALGRLTVAQLDDIRRLPQGLRGYYGTHWRVMKDQAGPQFDSFYRPVVCLLATVREPVSVSRLEEWTSLDRFEITRVIGTWMEFLNWQETGDGDRLYRAYHASFRDFLEREIGLRPYHNQIVDTALHKI